MSGQVQESFSAAFVPTGGTAFPPQTAAPGASSNGLPGGIANALLVTTTFGAAATITLLDGTTITTGLHTSGTMIRVRCTKISFGGAGAVIAMA